MRLTQFLRVAMAVAVTVLLAGCASRAPSPPGRGNLPAPKQEWQVGSQPDTHQLPDYLHFAGLSHGDTLDDVRALYGDPARVRYNSGRDGERYYTFATNYYDFEGEECLDVSYDKRTLRVEVVRAKCDQVRIQLLRKGIDDPKLALFGEHHRVVTGRYGSPESLVADNYEYHFGSAAGASGLVRFTCYDFWDGECKEICVHWFY
jgi:hypothetical protein